eukprot:CAMPEP_0196206914 /NCGR_PEP_ID=MMETSP0912-20130531/8097_1 /TAXON_ID=49265 /ORGANISM="Thalassiosira rotula, Strain GSO102" /LENGTH=182 /DNA_ID=CAMNT_0041481517 /DNA_START=178 /DNA_END=723 /DNA_ORIENTATION=+
MIFSTSSTFLSGLSAVSADVAAATTIVTGPISSITSATFFFLLGAVSAHVATFTTVVARPVSTSSTTFLSGLSAVPADVAIATAVVTRPATTSITASSAAATTIIITIHTLFLGTTAVRTTDGLVIEPLGSVKLLFLDSESEVAFAVATLKSLVGETIAFVFGGGEIVDTDTGSALFGLLDL